jgi:hypothetical protein
MDDLNPSDGVAHAIATLKRQKHESSERRASTTTELITRTGLALAELEANVDLQKIGARLKEAGERFDRGEHLRGQSEHYRRNAVETVQASRQEFIESIIIAASSIAVARRLIPQNDLFGLWVGERISWLTSHQDRAALIAIGQALEWNDGEVRSLIRGSKRKSIRLLWTEEIQPAVEAAEAEAKAAEEVSVEPVPAGPGEPTSDPVATVEPPESPFVPEALPAPSSVYSEARADLLSFRHAADTLLQAAQAGEPIESARTAFRNIIAIMRQLAVWFDESGDPAPPTIDHEKHLD